MINFNFVGLYQNQHNYSTDYKFNNVQISCKKTVLNDSFESSEKQAKFKGYFDVINPNVTPLQRLKNLAEEAHYSFRPLSNAIQRKDFDGEITKEEIISILEQERDKADMQGTKQRFQRLIDNIEKEYKREIKKRKL
jgi:hypothetical protein